MCSLIRPCGCPDNGRRRRHKRKKVDDDDVCQEQIKPELPCFSEIARTKTPYKELEATINDSKLVIRVQHQIEKDSTAESDCEQKCKSLADIMPPNVIFRKIDPKDDKNDNQEASRTITVHPVSESSKAKEPTDDVLSLKDHLREKEVPLKQRQVDMEDNPNIFVLRIRKNCENPDKRHKINVEYRIPRPWSRAMCEKFMAHKKPPPPPKVKEVKNAGTNTAAGKSSKKVGKSEKRKKRKKKNK